MMTMAESMDLACVGAGRNLLGRIMRRLFAVGLIVLGLWAGSATAMQVVMQAKSQTREIDNATVRVEDVTTGHWNVVTTSEGGRCIVLAFQLPPLPEGKRVGSASFHLYFVERYSNRVGPKDSLYGLYYRKQPMVNFDDYFEGEFGTDLVDAMPIEEDLISDFDTPGTWHRTTPAGDWRLHRYLQTQYDKGAQGGDWIFLRINSETEGYNVYSRHSYASIYYNGGTAQTPSPYAPYIVCTFTDAPAPAVRRTQEQAAVPELRGNLDPADIIAPIQQQRYYRFERERLGYNPRFGLNTVQFDSANRPYIRQMPSAICTLVSHPDGTHRWERRDFREILEDAFPAWDGTFASFGPGSEDRIVFDDDDDAYMVVHLNQIGFVLMHSADYGQSWMLHPLPKTTVAVRLEYRNGFNDTSGPPVVPVRSLRPANPPTLDLIVPKKNTDGTLTLPPKVRICDGTYRPIGGGLNNPMGQSNKTATRDGKTHVIYASRSTALGAGTPFFIRTYDHATRQVGELIYLGNAGIGEPDVHNRPGIVLDSAGYLHVILGAHGAPQGQCFRYRRSVAVNNASEWQEIVNLPSGLTYPSFLCDENDNLYVLGCDALADPDGVRHLVLLRKPASGAWGTTKTDLVIPFKDPNYGYIYNRFDAALDMDRRGNIYLSYWNSSSVYTDTPVQKAAFEMKWPCWPLVLETEGEWSITNRYAMPDARARSGAILVSKNRGDLWKIAVTKDFTDELQ